MLESYSKNPKLRRIHTNLCDIIIAISDFLTNQNIITLMTMLEIVFIMCKITGTITNNWFEVILPVAIYTVFCIVFYFIKRHIYTKSWRIL